MSLYCRNCGAEWNDEDIEAHIRSKKTIWKPCPRPSPGREMVESGVGGHMYDLRFEPAFHTFSLASVIKAIAAPMDVAVRFVVSLGYDPKTECQIHHVGDPAVFEFQRLMVMWDGIMRPVFDVHITPPDMRSLTALGENAKDVKLTWKIDPHVVQWPPPKSTGG